MGTIKLATASGGSCVLSPTNTASDVTLTVPAVTATLMTNKTAGAVLQVVQGTYSTETETTSSSYSDTGLSASITPTSSSSKILAILSMNGVGKNTNNTSVRVILLRSSTTIGAAYDSGYTASSAASYIGAIDLTILDSPATSSSVTYKAQFSSTGGNATARICSSNSTSTLTLMEIAA